ncbi:MAG: Smr/MutS family protein [Paludibacteraceae bacterium]|nr:Smr/MutS family protein [Paludibacteraceae bacterium]
MTCYPENIEQKIDFTVIRDELRRHCASPLGVERVEAMHMLTDYTEISRLLLLTDQTRQVLRDPSLSFPRGEIYDMREAMARIRIEGLFLDEAELFQLRKTIDYACQLEAFFSGLDEQRYGLLRELGSRDSLGVLGNLVRRIDRVIDRYGRLADTASPELGRIRHELTIVQGSVGRVLQRILRQAREDGIIDKDAAPTLREGRLVIPVPPAYKRKIGGIVHDESATGKTVFVEPQQVVEANNTIRELEGAERRERARILIELTGELREYVPQIMASEQLVGEVDFLRAKVALAESLGAVRPVLEDQPLIDWHEARHPVLYMRYLAQQKEVVPLSIRLTRDENRLLIISGPNAGGKSVCLKTVALVQYMMQCGLLVPLKESSRMGLFGRLMIDIGDEQSIDDDLSTYSGHLRNMKTFVARADHSTLILIDELGGGTEPLIGGAIAEAVLTQLHQQGVFGVVTTHYTNLKHFAEQTEGVVNGAMLYDRGRMQPLFTLSIGQAGSSFAVEIARQIGLPQAIIQQAIDQVGEEHIDYDKQLQEIARDKRYWENKRQHIRQREKHLEERIAYYEEQINALKATKREMLSEAKQQAADILSESQRTIERTIREIKEAKADKERTQRARKRVEAVREKLDIPVQLPTTGRQVLRDLSDLKQLKKGLLETPGDPAPKPKTKTTTVHSPVRNTIRQRTLSFERTLDLRGMRVDEALERLINYMDDAIMVNAGEVVILHGTGTGALKQLTRDYLQNLNHQRRKHGRTPLEYGDGDINHGGAGITLIKL